MNPLTNILAPILLLPVAVAPSVVPDLSPHEGNPAALTPQTNAANPQPLEAGPASAFPFSWLAEAWRTQSAGQVSIEQHIVIRISPRALPPSDPRIAMFSDAPSSAAATRVVERPMSKCVPMDNVVGVQIAPTNKLVLLLRDDRVVSAGLDKGCTARDFYAGFYVARSADGMMCAGRDKLQSRNGASCKLGKMKQLVEVGE